MQEPHRKGVANRSDPESCVACREVRGEALAGAGADQVLSREKLGPSRWRVFRGADALDGGGRQHRVRRHRETHVSHARSQTLRTHRNLSHGSREISRSSALDVGVDRKAKPKGDVPR
jgi:hypothetical protein